MSAETTGKPTLEMLATQLAEFARERDWDRFHSPKNLAMALAGEAGELLEHFQWLTEAESRALPVEVSDAVALEMADVLLYLVRLADMLGVDLAAAAARKIALNAEKYPVDRFRGSARKYDRDR
ncbi:MAG TPA: nucleotide pyrophosphohydrolase [Steroidobacteraceae bacterium]|jgi:dCTP diphosphatase|nr:nucleotide pyrophosphohydrolase [Steroidobacteraceae bacterium]